MNDRHPSAGPGPAGPAQDVSYGRYTSYEQQGTQHGYAVPDGHDTTWGHTPGQNWDTGASWGHGAAADWSGGSGSWGQLAGTDPYHGATGQTQFWEFGDSGQGQTGQWDTTAGHLWDTGNWNSTQVSYDTSGWGHHDQTGWNGDSSTGLPFPTQAGGQEPERSWFTGDSFPAWDTGAWEQTPAWGTDTGARTQTWDTGAYTTLGDPGPSGEVPHEPTLMVDLTSPFAATAPDGATAEGTGGTAEEIAAAETRTMEAFSGLVPPPRRDGGRDDSGHDDGPAGPAGHGRRRGAASRTGYRPRRKALLTVAVPSAAVIGVAGIAAASVSGGQGDPVKHTQTAAAPDTSAVASLANSKLDTQLAGLSQGANDFATRANRTQERIDLKARQEEERKRKEEEAARKEAERPKFVLPVNQHGLSAYFGQAGVNWMSVHTGIDFPVGYGTPVMAATDGTVRTQYNVAYGNMAIVTSPDGTETWYCHLSSTRVRSGKVKAGDVIAYSGNSGNSTGPHLHFEVRPGGSAVDPLPWLRNHDLDPT
ncbi:peptidoglycan DD-metalloendopeptidase family protein [Streptomyces gamaensis]|uniref:Peptidoglycan DD-metalloendopeptidase family protein n=1 Tax=Streptomyces gamaensis TaxID=1763542 RepID=A0ABW0Z7G7_9ACTN